MDGTLWNASESYAKVWNECSKAFGIKTGITGKDLLHYMGQPIEQIVKGLLKDTLALDVDYDAYLKKLGELENSLMPKLGGILFPYVFEGMNELAKYYPLMMLSNCASLGVKNFCTFTKLGNCFVDSITNGENLQPKSENMKIITARNNFKNAFYIGDTQHDCDETHKAGFYFGFMRYGFGTCNNAEIEFEDFKELVDYFKGL